MLTPELVDLVTYELQIGCYYTVLSYRIYISHFEGVPPPKNCMSPGRFFFKEGACHNNEVITQVMFIYVALLTTKGVYREEGIQLTMYRTYSSNFVSETGYAKNRIQYTDVNKWAVLFTEL